MVCSDNAVYIFGVILTYWVVSISMVYLNKFLMTNDNVSIPVPLFLTWYQCIITSCICWIAGFFGDRAQRQSLMGGGSSTNGSAYTKLTTVDLDSSMNGVNGIGIPIKQPSFVSQFPRAVYKPSIGIKIFPLSIIFVGMITLNNLCLQFVEVSFYNVARSLTIVFNVLFTWMFLGISTSAKTILCLGIVIAGFYIGAQGELNFSEIGTACGVLSSLFVSLNSIFTKKVLPVVDDNHWKLTWYNNVNACIIIAPLVYLYELDFILEHVEQLNSGIFWSAMTTAGIFGFAIGIVTVLQIRATSPLAHNFSGTAKAAVQSIMAFYIWGNEPTLHGVLGIFIVLGGSLLYTYMKMSESNSVRLMKSINDVESPPNGS